MMATGGSYMASLESRIEKLEKRLAMLDHHDRRGIEEGGTNEHAMDDRKNGNGGGLISRQSEMFSADPLLVPPGFRNPSNLKVKRKKVEAGEIEELVADLGYMYPSPLLLPIHHL